jgi:LysM repeat protein
MNRAIFLIFSLTFLHFCGFAQPAKWNQQYADYIRQYASLAVQQMRQYRIPASVTLAQGLLESGAGKSALARKANNHFGIKCNGWKGRKSYHDDDQPGECFRAYDSAKDSYVDHSLFLTTSPRYSRLFDLKLTDYKKWSRGLKACGYATSPTYAKRLIEIIETYRLYEYDKGKHAGGSLRPVHYFNKNYYVVARKGDTFRTVADDVDISYRKLARYNERDKNDRLEDGEYVWLQKKRSKAPKEYKGRYHVVAAGESLYSIAQRYGIRLKYLYKKNNLSPDYEIQVGDKLRVY